jgi:hypothetical protein
LDRRPDVFHELASGIGELNRSGSAFEKLSLQFCF